MTPKEKAEQLFNKFIIIDDLSDSTGNSLYFNAHAKQCALIAVDEVLEALGYKSLSDSPYTTLEARQYYVQVKQEIEKL